MLRVQRYNIGTPVGKLMFDQIRQVGAPAMEARQELEGGRAGAAGSYPGFKSATPVAWEPVEGGQAGWFVATIGCVHATNAQYQVVDLRAWAVQGSSVIKVVVSFAGDAAQAKKYAQEVLGKVKRADFGEP